MNIVIVFLLRFPLMPSSGWDAEMFLIRQRSDFGFSITSASSMLRGRYRAIPQPLETVVMKLRRPQRGVRQCSTRFFSPVLVVARIMSGVEYIISTNLLNLQI